MLHAKGFIQHLPSSQLSLLTTLAPLLLLLLPPLGFSLSTLCFFLLPPLGFFLCLLGFSLSPVVFVGLRRPLAELGLAEDLGEGLGCKV
ncbi:hypothetical protein T484DRAFT_2602812 [Baffinella frigidus]|nr:hypothetical protein T484DRAFT_2602812 [Cryptophyta sp. CCMP2293]